MVRVEEGVFWFSTLFARIAIKTVDLYRERYTKPFRKGKEQRTVQAPKAVERQTPRKGTGIACFDAIH